MPTVSVIMNCHNGERYLREAIDSVYAQTFSDWEIVLWDDASVDGTAAIAKSYDDRLRYFSGVKAEGLGAARNLAIAQARGQFLAFLDQDDIWLPTKLAKQIPLFDDPEVGLVFSDTIFFNGSGDTKRMYSDLRYATGHCFPDVFCEYFLSLETVVIRRSALDTLDAWFEPRFSLCEETDLFARIAYNWKLAMVDEPLAKWRVHSSSWTWRLNDRAVEERDLMVEKYLKLFPDFAERYANEIIRFRGRNAISKAKNLWNAQKSREARACLRPFIFCNSRAFLFFWLTVLPREASLSILSRLRRSISPDA